MRKVVVISGVVLSLGVVCLAGYGGVSGAAEYPCLIGNMALMQTEGVAGTVRPEMTVVVDAGKRHQTIEGFGTCMVAWVGRFRDLYRTEEFQKIYVEGVGCNMLRVNMCGPTYEKPTEDWRGISCEDFDLDADGGTGNHDWPSPIHQGIGNALHNALVAGNCSAFVPWQITEGKPSIHAMMVMDKYTPKTYTAMHYSRFIRRGAQRIDAEPGFGAVQVGAFLHEANGDVAVVAINPGEQAETLSLIFRNLDGPASLKAYRVLVQREVDKCLCRMTLRRMWANRFS